MTDILLDSPDNPAPAGIEAGYFTARDGKRLRYALVPASGRPLKGTVVLLHGRAEQIEKYFETARDFAARGFGVATFDWRGQGLSDRLLRNPRLGHVKSFRAHVGDLGQFFDEIVLPDCRGPYYIVAHSAGALAALMAAPFLANRVRRMVLSAPLLEFHGLPISKTTLQRLSGTLVAAGLGRRPIGRRTDGPAAFENNKLTSDPDRYRRNRALVEARPRLGIGEPTVRWVRAVCKAVETVRDPGFMAALRIPVLFVAAGADQVVSTRATEDYARRLRAGSLVTIDGARHELMQEADRYREQFFAAFDAFVPGSDSGA